MCRPADPAEVSRTRGLFLREEPMGPSHPRAPLEELVMDGLDGMRTGAFMSSCPRARGLRPGDGPGVWATLCCPQLTETDGPPGQDRAGGQAGDPVSTRRALRRPVRCSSRPPVLSGRRRKPPPPSPLHTPKIPCSSRNCMGGSFALNPAADWTVSAVGIAGGAVLRRLGSKQTDGYRKPIAN